MNELGEYNFNTEDMTPIREFMKDNWEDLLKGNPIHGNEKQGIAPYRNESFHPKLPERQIGHNTVQEPGRATQDCGGGRACHYGQAQHPLALP